MHRLIGALKDYAWGSPSHIPRLCRKPVTQRPVAEIWFGTHESGMAYLGGLEEGEAWYEGDAPQGAQSLADYVAADPQRVLGEGARRAFGDRLAYMVKFIAPEYPLSLQLHPTIAQAKRGFAAQNKAGISLDSAQRSFRDAQHKPEMLYALGHFDALAGFRAPRKALEIVKPLTGPIAQRIEKELSRGVHVDSHQGMEALAHWLFSDRGPDGKQINALAEECAELADRGLAPSPRAYRWFVEAVERFAGDPAAVMVLLMNPVTLEAGEVLFIEPGTVHMYIGGLGVEVQCASDNVLRLGLSDKPLAVAEALECMDFRAAPPLRIAPERHSEGLEIYYAPASEFQLGVCTAGEGTPSRTIAARGARMAICTAGALKVSTCRQWATISAGQALLLDDNDGAMTCEGCGTLLHISVP